MNARQLKNLLTDGIDLEDLILARADLKALDEGYKETGLDTPEWVMDKLGLVSTEIVNRNRAELARALKNAKARRAALATMDEKRKALDDLITSLDQKLSG